MSDPKTRQADGRPRARALGLPFPGACGPTNSITDIPGVEVGYTTLIDGDGARVVGQGPVRTGVTAILPRGKSTELKPVWAASYSLNGCGEMTAAHWMRDYGYFAGPMCITNTHSLGIAHHASAKWMRRHYDPQSWGQYNWAMPVVAETYDGYLSDIDGFHVTEEHVFAAIEGARSGPIAEGNAGGGTGMTAYEFKGGTGTASRSIEINGERFVVAALVQANFGIRGWFTVLGVPVGKFLREGTYRTHDEGSIIVAVGTDAPLLPIQLDRMARRIAIGISRTGTPGSDYSGDIFLAFSTANSHSRREPEGFGNYVFTPHEGLDPIFQGTVESTEEAVLSAMVAAETMTGCDNRTVLAIDHDELRGVMAQFNRLAD